MLDEFKHGYLFFCFRFLVPFYLAVLACMVLASILFLVGMRIQAMLHASVPPYQMFLAAVLVALGLMCLALYAYLQWRP